MCLIIYILCEYKVIITNIYWYVIHLKYRYFVGSAKLSFNDSIEDCKQFGGVLASYKTIEV